VSGPARPGQSTAGAGPELVLVDGERIDAGRAASGKSESLPDASAARAAAANPSAASAPGGISPLDRGLHFGDGVFETIACRHGRARFLSLHLDRLTSSCERLHIALSDVALVRQEIEQAAAAADASLIKLIVTRGVAVARGYAPSGKESATRVLLRYAWPLEDTTAWTDGVRVAIARMRLGENAALAGMKHLNRLEQVLARSEVPGTEAAELLLFSNSGRLISGTMSNVFIVRHGRLITPRMDVCGVAGVMRRIVLREAVKAGLAAEEGVLSEGDLEGADEVFVTNARIGIWPVRTIGSRSLTAGPVTRRLQGLIEPMLANPVDA
jgi:4-amino-4-deoxychorismate lyase